MDFLTQHLRPDHSESAITRFDDAIFATLVQITGLEAREFEAEDGVPGERVRLPCTSGGLGIRPHTGATAKAAFLGNTIKALQYMIDANVVGGTATETKGQFFAGRGSFDESNISSRFARFASSNNPVARVFSESWEELRV